MLLGILGTSCYTSWYTWYRSSNRSPYVQNVAVRRWFMGLSAICVTRQHFRRKKKYVTPYPLKTEATSFCSHRSEIFWWPAIRAQISDARHSTLWPCRASSAEKRCSKRSAVQMSKSHRCTEHTFVGGRGKLWDKVLVPSLDAKPLGQRICAKTVNVNDYQVVVPQ